MPKEFSRHERVSSLLQRELALLLQSQRDYLQLGIVTVSEVEVSRDMSVANAYVTMLGKDQTQRDEELQRLQQASGFLRKELGRNLRLRVIPELRFKYDDSIDNGLYMDKLLSDIKIEND
ncbi:MAG: 30S ribosome-binding factor RbfA [Gammaproteobacteria bacterium]|nr:30S ribosome-binding factor RbfA [Gammaproteobacteria bacterium]